MAWTTNVLVVANRTAGSSELLDALKKRGEGGETRFTLLVPCDPGGGRTKAREALDSALEQLRHAGLEVSGTVGSDADPVGAVMEVWDPAEYDEIVVSTFPSGASHWLNMDLPQRVAKLTDAHVDHVVAESMRSEAPA